MDSHLQAKIGQYALIQKDNAVLLLNRTRSRTWSLPGGRLNINEDWEGSLKREIYEETSLLISDPKPFSVDLVKDDYQTKYCVYFVQYPFL